MTRPHSEHRTKSPRWRLATPLVGAICGGMFVVSAISSDGTDLRPGRINTFAELVRSESRHLEGLQNRANDLDGQVDELGASVRDRKVQTARDRVSELEPDAGFTPVTGDGIEVTLSDSPRELWDQTPRDERKNLVVHQQDLQAVVNAMWDGGAEAVTIQGQRVVTTTGIKCAGSSVQLNGILFPEPYVIKAIGDPEALIAAIDGNTTISNYRYQSTQPDIAIGWSMVSQSDIKAPAFAGVQSLEYASPAN